MIISNFCDSVEKIQRNFDRAYACLRKCFR
eukprot:COSAG05_NODE_14915_length_382_cov_0.933099_1_plen_29_part_01